MMKWKKRMGAAFAAALMAASLTMACVPAWATEETSGGTTSTASFVYTPVTGGTTTFIQHLLMDSEANIPNATFSYKIEAASGNELLSIAQNKTGFEVLAGRTPQNVTMSCGSESSNTNIMTKVEDNSSDSVTYTLPYTATDTAVDGVRGVTLQTATELTSGDSQGHGTLETRKKCVFKVVTLNFNNCSFSEPGVYRYKLTKSADNQGFDSNTDTVRYIDVYVTNETDEETGAESLNVDSILMHTGVNEGKKTGTNDSGDTIITNELADKSGGYVDTYNTSDLTFGKTVSGNQASRDKYFKFTVTISNAVPGTVYTVDNTGDAEPSPSPSASTNTSYTQMANPSEIIAPKENESGYNVNTKKSSFPTDFYLKDGQSITIKGLSKDTTWTITEAKEDYDSEPVSMEPESEVTTLANEDISTTGVKTIGATVGTNNQAAYYENTREGTIPTGIILTIAPFAAAVLIGGVGVVMILLKKRKVQEG